MRVLADYFRVNRKRITKDFLRFYLGTLLLVIGESVFDFKVMMVAPLAALLFPAVAVPALHALAAYLIVWAAAKRQQVPLSVYIRSADYSAKILDRDYVSESKKNSPDRHRR